MDRTTTRRAGPAERSAPILANAGKSIPGDARSLSTVLAPAAFYGHCIASAGGTAAGAECWHCSHSRSDSGVIVRTKRRCGADGPPADHNRGQGLILVLQELWAQIGSLYKAEKRSTESHDFVSQSRVGPALRLANYRYPVKGQMSNLRVGSVACIAESFRHRRAFIPPVRHVVFSNHIGFFVCPSTTAPCQTTVDGTSRYFSGT